MGRNRKSLDIDNILKTWDRRGIPEMTKGQREALYNRILAMSPEELIRLSNDTKKPIFMVNIARGLLSKKAFENQERIIDRLDGKTINANMNVKREEKMTLEEINAEIARLEAFD